MGENTHIQWCDDTWNFVRGCRKVSEECENCYITETLPFLFFTNPDGSKGLKHGSQRIVAAEDTWKDPIGWNRRPWNCSNCGNNSAGDGDEPCVQCRKHMFHRRRVFTLSLGDFFDHEFDIKVLIRALSTIRECTELDFLIVTKRIEEGKARLAEALRHESTPPQTKYWLDDWLYGKKPPVNVWMIVSAGNQRRYNERKDWLAHFPAVVRGWSIEPMLSFIVLHDIQNFDWFIFGGESGKGEMLKRVRPCNALWVRHGVQQCVKAGKAPFVKQLGSKPFFNDHSVPGRPERRIDLKHCKGGNWDEWPESFTDIAVRDHPVPNYAKYGFSRKQFLP